jgi:hypothetical protein
MQLPSLYRYGQQTSLCFNQPCECPLARGWSGRIGGLCKWCWRVRVCPLPDPLCHPCQTLIMYLLHNFRFHWPHLSGLQLPKPDPILRDQKIVLLIIHGLKTWTPPYEYRLSTRSDSKLLGTFSFQYPYGETSRRRKSGVFN